MLKKKVNSAISIQRQLFKGVLKMRMLTLLFTTMFLHGCVATSYVIDKVKGNFNFFPIDVESARFDDAQKEFVLCVIDLSDAQNKGRGRFTIKIPQDIIEKGGNDRLS